MKFTLRNKILAAYGGLITLFLFILFTGFWQFRQIAARLDLIQLGYLPIVKVLSSFSNSYDLDDSFSVEKIRLNRSNRLLLESLTLTQPRLVKQNFHRVLEEAQQKLQKTSTPQTRRSLDRIHELTLELLQRHEEYVKTIQQVIQEVERPRPSSLQTLEGVLQEQKQIVKKRIEFLSRRLDERIRQSIQGAVQDERKAVFVTLGLSFFTLLIAAIIGLLSIFSLRPLEKLKQTSKEIAAGNLQRRVDIDSQDEVGELAQEFNRMADSIVERDRAIQLQQEQLLQTEKMAVIGRMASKISHEIRNPLNSLGLNVELLEEEVQGEEGRKIVSSLATEIDRLNRITERYLHVARSPISLSEKVEITKIIRHLEDLIRPECEKREIAFHSQMESDLPLLKLDITRFEQALLNLLRNAMEAVQEKKSMGIQVSKQPHSIEIRVWDEGSGIPPELLPHIFKPFYTTKNQGTGLGLAITHEIVREMGGTIGCQSSVGKGSTFILQIPYSSDDV